MRVPTSIQLVEQTVYFVVKSDMRIFVAVTDNDWFTLHAAAYRVDEVNFWRPSPEATFKRSSPESFFYSSFTRQ